MACDGQILVLEDMLGLSPRVPRFVKRYGELGPSIEAAVAAYAADVRARAFPGPEHVYPMRAKAKVGRAINGLATSGAAAMLLCLARATSIG